MFKIRCYFSVTNQNLIWNRLSHQPFPQSFMLVTSFAIHFKLVLKTFELFCQIKGKKGSWMQLHANFKGVKKNHAFLKCLLWLTLGNGYPSNHQSQCISFVWFCSCLSAFFSFLFIPLTLSSTLLHVFLSLSPTFSLPRSSWQQASLPKQTESF